MRIEIILNRDGGTLKTSDPDEIAKVLGAALKARGHIISTSMPQGKELKAALTKAATSTELDCIVIGGGDGSVSLAASLCRENGKILGVLPVGTMNFFARSLQMPLILSEAIEALANSRVREVDVGTVNGRLFVHQVSIGVQPRMVELRKSIPYRSRIGKMSASFRAALKTLISPPSFRARLASEGIDEVDRFSILAVSNNAYGDGHLPYADTLDDGVLGIYSAPRLTFLMNLKLARDMFFGRWTDNEHMLSQSTDRVQIDIRSRTGGRKMSVDGEIYPLEKNLDIRLHRRGLKAFAP